MDIAHITLTLVPTNAPVYQTVVVPQEVVITATPGYKVVKGRYSWYYPPLGGINCDRNGDGTAECDYLANGQPWGYWYGKGAACPFELPFGTRIHIVEYNLDLYCVDRGGEIVVDSEGYYWIDHLTNEPVAQWSTPITIWIYDN